MITEAFCSYAARHGRKADNGAPIGNNVTADLAIRQAVNLALDRETLVDVALNGFGRPAFGPADSLPWSHKDEKLATPNLSRANALLDEAGWVRKEEDGLRYKTANLHAFVSHTPPATPPANSSPR